MAGGGDLSSDSSSEAARIIDHEDVGAEVVQAAGGLVLRRGPAGLTEVVIVHRPAYEDWSFPKGKLEPGETLEQAALREVEEETGLSCRIVEPLACTAYRDRKGREKTVCYWTMEALGGRFVPHDEVDQLRWLTFEEAVSLLSYERDRELLRSLETRAA